MALERIAAIGVVPPAGSAIGTAARRPATGETIELVFEAAAADEVLASTVEGVQLKLAGLGTLGRDLTAGDVLLVKVLTTSPQLEVMVFDTAPRASRPFETEQAAMRPDQVAWLRQVVWRPPDSAAMASAWRGRLLSQIQRQAQQPDPTDEAHAGNAATATLLADDATPNPFARPPPLTDPWLLIAYAWGGLRVMLRALPADPDDGPPPNPREAMPLALRVMLELPGLGGVTLQFQLTADGVLLDLAAERAEALQPLRNLLPEIVAALARAKLRVLRCRLARGLPNGTPWNPLVRPSTGALVPGRTVQSGATPEAVLPPLLFRAAAEVVAVLCAAPHASSSPAPAARSPAAAPLLRKQPHP
jgi:hypothetical protein